MEPQGISISTKKVKETGHVDFCQMASTGFIINVICAWSKFMKV